MKRLVLESFLLLLEIEFLLYFHDLHSLHARVAHQTRRRTGSRSNPHPGKLCHAMDLACIFYLKSVLCLQRSAATTILLRRYSYAAEMVIGARLLPFASHAWVELDGAVINDKPYMSDIYQVLERC